jgi:hypothetical protein
LGAAFGGRDWGAISPKRGTNGTRPPNAQSQAVWGTVWETQRDILSRFIFTTFHFSCS